MPEHITPIPARVVIGYHRKDYLCDNCETPTEHTGTVFTTCPALYEHQCPECNTKYTLREIYPGVHTLWQ